MGVKRTNTDEKAEISTVDDEVLPDAPPSNKKQESKTKTRHILHQHTIRKPSWTYFHLQLFSAASRSDSIDILTAKKYTTSALARFLGLHGTAIPMDIMKLEGRSVWIRVPREHSMAVHEALSSWIGGSEDGGVRWIIKGRDEWLVRLVGGDGLDLFKP